MKVQTIQTQTDFIFREDILDIVSEKTGLDKRYFEWEYEYMGMGTLRTVKGLSYKKEVVL